MGKGRPRKVGRRDKSGKLRPEFVRDKGSPRTAEKVERYGANGADAIGRAFENGLLGENGEALMIAARKVKLGWKTHIQAMVPQIKCPLDQSRGGGMAIEYDPQGARYRQDRTFDSLSAAGPAATLKSFAFYGLVIDEYPDSGPGWLDRIIEGEARPQDKQCLDAAIQVLVDLAA